MNHVHLLAHAVAILLLVVATVTDIKSYTIANRLCLAVLALLPVAWLVGGPVPPAWSSASALAISTLAFGILWHAGKSVRALRFGGGDWKLLSALSPWVGLGGLADLLLDTALAGGVLTVAVILFRASVPPDSRLRLNGWVGPILAADGIPYGVAIAAGGILGIVGLVETVPI